jgi:hypothetical protein
MAMPTVPGHGATHAPRRRLLKPNPVVLALVAFEMVFWAAVAVCFLGAVSRAAGALKSEARLKALDKIPEAFTEDERMELVHKVKTRALGPF